jgi:hypothetical protein
VLPFLFGGGAMIRLREPISGVAIIAVFPFGVDENSQNGPIFVFVLLLSCFSYVDIGNDVEKNGGAIRTLILVAF